MTVQQLAWRHFTKKHSISLRPEVVSFLSDRLSTVPDDQVGQIIEYIANAYVKHGQSSVVEMEILEEIIKKLFRSHKVQTEYVNAVDYAHVIDKYPMLCYNEHTQAFEYSHEAGMRDRFGVLLERVHRHLREHNVDWKLTFLKALKTKNAGDAHVFGMIYKRGDDFFLEDLEDAIAVKLSPDISNVFDGQFLVAHGSFSDDDQFTIDETFGVPLDKKRSFLKVPGALCPLKWVAKETESSKALRELEARCPEAFLACFSEVWLDRDDIFASFEQAISSLVQSNRIPSIIVLLGNFHSNPSDIYSSPLAAVSEYRLIFKRLSAMLARYPLLTATCKFLLSPGPNDPFAAPNVLPRAKFPESLFDDFTGVTYELSEDPVRLFWFSRELVFTRNELTGRLEEARASGSPPTTLEAAAHVLSQGFLFPVIGNLSSSFRLDSFGRLSLCPAPDLLVVAEKGAVDNGSAVEETAVGNPERFAYTRRYMTYALDEGRANVMAAI